MKKGIIATLMLLLFLGGGLFIVSYHGDQENEKEAAEGVVSEIEALKPVSFESKDGIQITGDLYRVSDPNAPFIILFHQASYSRGEYRCIAPKLNEMGYNCLAVDQRSGNTFKGIRNETYLKALDAKQPTGYVDAYQDMDATIDHVMENYQPEKLVVWGSSYSAALLFVLFSEHQKDIDAMLAFSPGEYFSYNERSISDFARDVTCPIFITSSRAEVPQWKEIGESIGTGKKFLFAPEGPGVHGSSALLEENKNNQEYWDAVSAFLKDSL